jgi:hypothetical protein
MQEPQTYNIEKEKILQFDKLMLRLKGALMDGLIFEATINMVRFRSHPSFFYLQDFEDVVNSKYSVRGNQLFREKFDQVIRIYFSDLRVESSSSMWQ